MIWLTWRQHRVQIGWTAAVVLPTLVPATPRLYSDLVLLVFASAVAVFWGAPLVAREYEERTHLVTWGQDVSPLHWLAGKCLVLCGAQTVLALVLDWEQVGVTLCGFALGVLTGALLRRTVPAMALTLVLFVLVRIGFGDVSRAVWIPSTLLCGVLALLLFPVAFVVLPRRRMGVA